MTPTFMYEGRVVPTFFNSGGGGGGIEPPPGAVIGFTVCFCEHTSPLPALDSSPDTPQAPLQKPGISKR